MEEERGITARSVIAVTVVAVLALALVFAFREGRVGTPPRSLDLSRFYTKYLDVGGLPVVSSPRVPDAALFAARAIIRHMLLHRPDVLRQLASVHVRVAVMAVAESTTDIPEHSNLEPRAYWNARARGLGATVTRRACSAAEENLLGYLNDPYRGESILVHEFAHTIHVMGLSYLDPGFDGRLDSLYHSAVDHGLYDSTYAATNREEYWAEGVQSWFGCNLQADPPDGIHNHVNTRIELEAYDPMLARLIRSVFHDVGPIDVPRPMP